MSIKVNISDKREDDGGVSFKVEYVCQYCASTIRETLYLNKSIRCCIAFIDNHSCPECRRKNDLELDLF